jgi:RNA polymerase sigma factor (sigma-70 family)
MGAGIDIDQFYRRYGPMVFRRCLQLLGDDQKAADAMQDVFVQVIRNRSRLTNQAPSSLLNRIATNVSLNKRRNDRIRNPGGSESILDAIAVASDVEERFAAVRLVDRLLGREPPSTRTIAVLHLVDGLTHQEVAREVGLSVSGVRKRLRTLKGRIKQIEVD